MIIRNEKKEDYRTVEEMIKKAFWNLYVWLHRTLLCSSG